MIWMIPRQNQSWVSEFILLGFSRDPMTNNTLFIVFLLIYLSSVLGNGLIILLICLDTHLHTPMYFFLCLLALLDMGYVTTTIPQMLVHLLAKSQTITFAGCWLQMYMFSAWGITECMLFVVMAYDRYVAICHPLNYTVILTWNLCIRLAAGTWVCGFFFSLIHTFFTMRLPYCGPNKVNHYFCEGPSVRSLACMDTHLIEIVDLAMSVFINVVPISLIVASYIHIAMAIFKIKSTQGRCKAFSTCASHLTVVTLFYIPAIYIYLRPNSSSSPEHDKQISLFYNVFSALLNPMVYSLRNKDIKRAFLKMIDMVGGLLNLRRTLDKCSKFKTERVSLWYVNNTEHLIQYNHLITGGNILEMETTVLMNRLQYSLNENISVIFVVVPTDNIKLN